MSTNDALIKKVGSNIQEKADDIAARIEEHEKSLMEKLHNLFGDK